MAEQTWWCDVCLKYVNSERNLYRHRARHAGRKLFTCPQCERSFDRSDALVRHVRTHGIRTNEFECITCHRSFTRREHLRTHALTHEVEQARATAAQLEQRLADVEDDNTTTEEPDMPGSQERGGRGACVACNLRAGTLDRCRHCNKPVHYFCARLWFRPGNGLVACPACQTSEETHTTPSALEQAALEKRFLSDFLAANGYEQRQVEPDGLCFFRCVAMQVNLEVKDVARQLLQALIDTDDLLDIGDMAMQAKREAASILRAGTHTLARRWDSQLLDLIPRFVHRVFGRPLQIFQLGDRQVVVLWLPEDERQHTNPIRLSHTGQTIAGQAHYDVVIKL